MEDGTMGTDQESGNDLVAGLTEVLNHTLSQLEAEFPFTDKAAATITDKFITPESFEAPSLAYAEDYIMAATFQMMHFSPPEFCILEDKESRDRIAQFSNEEDPGTELKPKITTDALAFQEKEFFVDAILKELWKSLCGKDAERANDRKKVAGYANTAVGSIGTKLATDYGIAPTAMIALVGAAALWAAKVGFRAFCAMMTEKHKAIG